MSPKPSGFTTNPICLHRPLPLPWVIMRYLLSQGQLCPLEGAPRNRGSAPHGHSPQPLASGGTRSSCGVLVPLASKSRKPWQGPVGFGGFWEPNMQRPGHPGNPKRGCQLKNSSSVHPSLTSSYSVSLPGPSGWCLPGSLEPVPSEPDWAGAPGDSSSPPHLTGW